MATVDVKIPDLQSIFLPVSGRFRWSVCPGSAVLPRKVTQQIPAAAEGDCAHKVAEWALAVRFGIGDSNAPMPRPEMPEGLTSPPDLADWHDQMRIHAIEYAEHSASFFDDLPQRARNVLPLIEVKLDPIHVDSSQGTVKCGGRADVLLYDPDARRLIAGDYKYGATPVGAGSRGALNPQLGATLVLAAAANYGRGVDAFGCFVFQPRTRLGEPFQFVAPLTWEDVGEEDAKLRREMQHVAAAADAAAACEDVPVVPGDHCKYCPSAYFCRASSEFGQAALDAATGRVPVVELTDDQVMSLWAQRSAFKQFEADLRERVQMLHASGSPAVRTTSRKGALYWSNPAAAVEALMLADKFALLAPPAVSIVQSVLGAEAVAAWVSRSPDVITYRRTAESDGSPVARHAFQQFLRSKSHE